MQLVSAGAPNSSKLHQWFVEQSILHSGWFIWTVQLFEQKYPHSYLHYSYSQVSQMFINSLSIGLVLVPILSSGQICSCLVEPHILRGLTITFLNTLYYETVHCILDTFYNGLIKIHPELIVEPHILEVW